MAQAMSLNGVTSIAMNSICFPISLSPNSWNLSYEK